MATNVTLHRLILDAFGVQASQLVGGPDWISTERFDVIATDQKDDGRNGERERAMLAVAALALSLDPKMQAAYYNLGLVLVAENRQDEARVAFRRAVTLAPDSPFGQAARDRLKAIGDGG